jgi:hypothetical protein
MNIDLLIFFVYPGPRGSEEPLRCKPASSAQPKSIYSPWGWGKFIDFQAICIFLLMITDTYEIKLIRDETEIFSVISIDLYL